MGGHREVIILSEVNQTDNDKYHDTAYMWNLKKKDTNELMYQYKTEIYPQTWKINLWLLCWTQACPILCDPMDRGPPGSSVHGMLQARIMEWVAISSSRGSSWLRDQTLVFCVSFISSQTFNTESPEKPKFMVTKGERQGEKLEIWG